MSEFALEVAGLRPRLLAYAVALSKDETFAEDLTQETITKALEKQHQFRRGTNLLAWMTTILRNLFLTLVRREGRIVEDPEGTHEATLHVPPGQLPREELRDVETAIGKLPAKQSRSLYLIAVMGMEYDEAALLADVPTGTVKSQVSRARSKLKELLNEHL
ncbi:sigma-70 family RNA polymerase sigma factor [Nitratireductor aquibiodomus]|uniref:sigma-70 family RNA polymerase sigma factor n=1 Tax=Nitratireductor aquibiodomus TaxID=204799 RepID=UPI0019D3406C|nr:sigma-70 family RNA polymerase sigma factor [Nitratireductor aquibiodomus]MBN7759816.1 sigma-70 family RNA polymerase sigma factor [Nitratireductor aquibiodomus]